MIDYSQAIVTGFMAGLGSYVAHYLAELHIKPKMDKMHRIKDKATEIIKEIKKA